ncbi:MAG: twin-arginine translocase TatA/TatE family subunit [Gordonibacter sp.]|nr:twin-arginine translocase TatA/TatE family subunit [Gordonibacter sp.]
MKILGMGMPELLIILAVILLIFGPKNLPKLGGAIGKTVKNLRDGMGGDKKVIEEAEDEDEDGEEEVEEVVEEKPVRKTTTAAKKTTTAAKKKAE